LPSPELKPSTVSALPDYRPKQSGTGATGATTLAGFFISGDAPSINSYAGRRFVGQSATAFALVTGVGNIGGGVGPYLIGVIGNHLGLETGIWLMPLFSLGLAALSLGWYFQRKIWKPLEGQ
jgi:fucose permease